MRPELPFALALAGSPLLLVPGIAAAQGWQQYPFPDDEFTVQFPVAPTVSKDVYRMTTGVETPATVFSASQDSVLFTVTVGDFSHSAADGEAVIQDAIKAAGREGEIRVDVDARINREYGHELSVKGRDGSYSMLALFFFDHRFYQLVGRSAPPDAETRSAQTIRFQQSLQFHGM